jgi:hypothetical protein
MAIRKKAAKKKEAIATPPEPEGFDAGYRQCALDVLGYLNLVVARRICVKTFEPFWGWINKVATEGPQPTEAKADVVSDDDANAQVEGADAHDPEPE